MVKEQFRSWSPKGQIKVKYTVDKDKGIFDYWETDAQKLFSQIDAVVTEFQQSDIKLTNRQLYYQLVGKNLIPNATEVYKRVCTFLTDGRYGGLIDWEAIEDRGRVPSMPLEFENIQERIQLALNNFRLQRWQDQEYYVELYCEKQAGETVLKPVAEKYHIYFGYNKGYSGASAMYDLAKRLQEKLENGKRLVVLYFGDHDPSGLDMVRDIKERLTEFLTKGEFQPTYIHELLEVIPVALTTEQVKKYNPPPNPAKFSDPRAAKYVSIYGKVSWELDSLNPLELRKIAEAAIQKHLNIKKYNAWIEKEKKESQALKDFGDKLAKGAAK